MTAGRAACPGCGGAFVPVEGPTHPYMTASPGCWASYGEILAREYESPALFAACHRLTVDAYALQHPGDPQDRRGRQSVWLHFESLDAIFDRGASLDGATALMKELAHRPVPAFAGRPANWSVTLADMLGRPVEAHAALVRRWAEAAYAGWRPIFRN